MTDPHAALVERAERLLQHLTLHRTIAQVEALTRLLAEAGLRPEPSTPGPRRAAEAATMDVPEPAGPFASQNETPRGERVVAHTLSLGGRADAVVADGVGRQPTAAVVVDGLALRRPTVVAPVRLEVDATAVGPHRQLPMARPDGAARIPLVAAVQPTPPHGSLELGARSRRAPIATFAEAQTAATGEPEIAPDVSIEAHESVAAQEALPARSAQRAARAAADVWTPLLSRIPTGDARAPLPYAHGAPHAESPRPAMSAAPAEPEADEPEQQRAAAPGADLRWLADHLERLLRDEARAHGIRV